MKKTILRLAIAVVIIGAFFVINVVINERNKEEYGDYHSDNEFLRTIDCAGLFDSNPPGTCYKISFDLKTAVPGTMTIYQQNGTSCRYSWNPKPTIETTTEYKHYEVEIEPVMANPDVVNAYLSFYGEYGSGVIPVIRNLVIEPK